jgi:hydrogenase maturation protease
MLRTLIIGYGNIDRGDDGVAHAVINALRRRQGRDPLDEENTGLEGLGAEVDTVLLSQLTPELVETLRDYDHLLFVDAHIYPGIDDLHCRAVAPEDAPSILIHHFTPGALLALLRALYGKAPIGHLVSVRGHDFDFHRHLSPETRALSERAIDYIERWLCARGHASMT